MGEHGFSRFPGNLDPSAQEFRPSYPSLPTGGYHQQQQQYLHQQFSMFPPQHHHHPQQILFPYTTHLSPPTILPPPPPPPPYYHHHNLLPPQQNHSPPINYFTPPPPTLPPLPPPSTSPTRALLLSSVPNHTLSESTIRHSLELFGDVRAVQMDRASEGIVAVHFYDLRAAHAALEEIREQHMQQQSRLRSYYSFSSNNNNNNGVSLPPPCPNPGSRGLVNGRAVWAQFMIPGLNAYPDGHNQGTLVVFNLVTEISTATLRDIFETFGLVRELRETPAKKHQRFVEYFDIRDAAKALTEMNGREIYGKQIVIEFSRPGGGHGKRFNSNHHHNHNRYHTNNFIGHSDAPPNSIMKYEFLPQQQHNYIPPPRRFSRRYSPSRLNTTTPTQHYSTGRRKSCFTKSNVAATSSSVSTSSGLGNCSSSSAVEIMGNQMVEQLSLNENNSDEGKEMMVNNTVTTNYNVDVSCANSTGSSSTSSGKVIVITKPRDVVVRGSKSSGGCGSSRPWKGKSRSFDPRFLIKEDAIVDPTAIGYKDGRTTVMIKNIPNKYSQKLLLNMLDNHCIHCNEQILSASQTTTTTDDDDDDTPTPPLSSYDFVYLPIDFNNKCNVGYGFVNMTSPEATLRLYKSFHQQHWEVFNSRKICEVTYARVQGLESLKEHFKNSKFACETDEYLPVVFNPPRDGRRSSSSTGGGDSLSPPIPIVVVGRSSGVISGGGGTGSTTTTTTMSCSLESMPSSDNDDDDRDYYDVSVTTPPSTGGSDDGGGSSSNVNAVDDNDDDDVDDECRNDGSDAAAAVQPAAGGLFQECRI